MSKKYYVAKIHNGNRMVFGGTLEELNTQVFGYSLECGNSWNSKIPRFPKSIKTLVKALNDSAYECNRYHDHYEIAEPGTFDPNAVM